MIKIIYLILCLILGILLYQILKYICECNIEGFGLFGRAKLGKCCPMDYMYSDTDKKCVKICDGCAMGAYSPMTLKTQVRNNIEVLEASFDCKENDSSEVYNYEKINRLYKKSDLMDQYDFGFDLDSEMMSGSGVQAAEEGGNEAWAGISTDASTAQLSTDTIDIETSIYPFEGVPEELYYTDKDDCKELEESDTNVDSVRACGYWKLDEDPNYTYLKDNPDIYYPPPWIITESPPSELGISNSVYRTNNEAMIKNITETLNNPDSPISKKYAAFIASYISSSEIEDETKKEETTTKLLSNRASFCGKILAIAEANYAAAENILAQPLFSQTPDLNLENLCTTNMYNGDNWNTLCNNISNGTTITSFVKGSANYLCISENTENTDNTDNADNADNYICPKSGGMELDDKKTFCP